MHLLHVCLILWTFILHVWIHVITSTAWIQKRSITVGPLVLPFYGHSPHSTPPSLYPLATTNLFPVSEILSFQDCPVNGRITQYVTFSDWLFKLIIIHLRSTRVSADISSCLLPSSIPWCVYGQ